MIRLLWLVVVDGCCVVGYGVDTNDEGPGFAFKGATKANAEIDNVGSQALVQCSVIERELIGVTFG